MSLSTPQIELVQRTFEQVSAVPDAVAELFYMRLFQLDPSLRPLFKGDMTEQGRKLMQIIAFAVGSLYHLDALVPAVRALGKRHVVYGVKPEHYDTVGAALIWTLEQGLKQDFTPETREAWVAVYTLLAQTAIENAYQVEESTL